MCVCVYLRMVEQVAVGVEVVEPQGEVEDKKVLEEGEGEEPVLLRRMMGAL